MSILCKPYEISLWRDEWQDGKYVEKRMMVIGSNEMDAQCHAFEPKLTRKTNGEVSFSFKLYYQYIDNITGEKVHNPFVDYITNESKVKLHYNNEWFDLLVKNISEESSNCTYLYTLQDQNVIELSKNGFNLTLDSSLMNNMGTIDELGERILKDTDWIISTDSEKIVQTEDEALVPCLVTGGGLTAFQIDDSDLPKKGAIKGKEVTIPNNAIIYVFYSSCSGADPYRFQFLYKEGGFGPEDKDSDRIIVTKGCQYFIDDISYYQNGIFRLPVKLYLTYPEGNTSVSILYRGRRYVYGQETEYHSGLNRYLQKYVTTGNKPTEYYGYTKTYYMTPNLVENIVTNAEFSGDAGWRGSKFCNAKPERPEGVSSAKKLNTYLRSYSWEQWQKYIVLNYVGHWDTPDGYDNSHIKKGDIIKIEGVITNQNDSPITVYAEVTNTEFLTEPNGHDTYNYAHVCARTVWYSTGSNELNMTINPSSFRVQGTGASAKIVEGITDHLNGAFSETNIYFPCLKCGQLNSSTYLRKVLVNSGPYDKKQSFKGFTKGEKYIVKMEFYCASKNENDQYTIVDFADFSSTLSGAQVKVRLSNFELDTKRNGYVWEQYNLNNKFMETDIKLQDYDRNGLVDHTLLYSRAILDGATNSDPGAVKLTRAEDGLYSYTQIVEAQGTLSEEEFLKDNYRLFIEFPDVNKAVDSQDFIFIKKLSVFKYYVDANETGYTPEGEISSASISYIEEQNYFPVVGNENKTEKELAFASKSLQVIPLLSSYAGKRSSINVKESNYFNAIQTLAETFECWPQIVVEHDTDGTVLKKSICFKNYIGQPNYSGFKYGVNSKDIKRTLDSKQIVSKLIVKANSNEFAKNGFCSIARAAANELRDNTLYNFDHYINTGLLNDVEQLQTNLYLASEKELTDLTAWLSTTDRKLSDAEINSITAQGYYPKLRLINLSLEKLAELITNKSIPLAQATADYNVNKAGYDAAVEEFIKVTDKFYNVAGFSYDSISTDNRTQNEKDEGKKSRLEQVQGSTTLTGYLAQITELISQKKTYKDNYEKAQSDMTDLQAAYDILKMQYDTAVALKQALNNKFYAIYYRFIQEGTWIDESYMDDNLYYNDAKVVLYNSTKPKVSYTLSVISLAGIPGYELIDFKIGDQTFIEDTEFFGYDLDGLPYHEQVTVTETIENLEDPSKNTIKVQNYENQFQDLFKKITATTQSVKYSEGSYQRAAALAEADTAHKISYLTDALTDAATILTNAGNQTWTLDEKGLTIEDPARGEGLRAVGGAILLKQKDEKGNDKWVTGVTSKGVSADLITAGQINTGEIQIMNANQPTFRWDTHGLTAYDFDNSTHDSRIAGWNPTKGVRFDRFGLYGYSGIDGETWHPTTISGKSDIGTIEDFSTFYLTWEGLKVKNSNGYTLRIGDGAKNDKEKDKSLLVVTNNRGNAVFAITETGTITWGADSSPTQVVYSTSYSAVNQKPQNGKAWKDFPPKAPKNDPEAWHQEWNQIADWYASYTYDGGKTWTAPIKVVAANTEEIIEYYQATTTPDEDTLNSEKWEKSPTRAGHDAVNKYLWNYEEIKLTNGTSLITNPVIISTQAKEIQNIYNFYIINNSNEKFSTLPTITQPGDWSYSINGTFQDGKNGVPTTTEGNPYLWNYEIITYTDNTQVTAGPSIIGTHGSRGNGAYNLTLSNDFDTVVYNNNNTLISTLPTTTVRCYEGHSQLLLSKQHIGLEASDDWTKQELNTLPEGFDTGKGHYYFGNGTFSILHIPNNEKYQDNAFVFTWTDGKAENPSIYGQATFNVKVITSLVDYDLLIDQTTFNSSQSGGEFAVRLIKKTSSGIENLLGPVDGLRLFKKVGAQEEKEVAIISQENKSWVKQGYQQRDTAPITYTLKSNDGTIIWDTETVEFVVDGSSIKKIDTSLRELSYEQWTQPQTPNTEAYIEIGATFSWNTGENYDNSSIHIGDTAYLVGAVSDRYATDSTKQSITIYGIVTGVTTEAVTMTTSSVVWGGAKGDKGDGGTGIRSVTVTYATSTSSTDIPKSWDSSIPEVAEGEYLWTRTVTDYTDTTIEDTVTYTYTKQGKEGEKGETGSPGTSVSIISILYKEGSSATTPPDGEWYNNVVEVSEGKYLWTKTTFSDGNISYGVARQGTSGTSPYTISLDEDFALVPTDKDGNAIAWTNIQINPAIFQGDTPIEDWSFDAQDDTTFYITVAAENNTVTFTTEEKILTVTGLSTTRGSIIFTLYEKVNEQSTPRATTKFEIAKAYQGETGTSPTYWYAKTEPTSLKANYNYTIKINVYQAIGNTTTEYTNPVYYTLFKDSKTSSSQQNQQLAWKNGCYTINTSTAGVAKAIDIYIYASKGIGLLDKVTLSVVSDGADGQSQWTVYHDASTISVSEPGVTYNQIPNYADIKKNEQGLAIGWYKDQQKSSVYSSTQMGKTNTATGWGPPTRISGTLTTKEDLLNILETKTDENDQIIDGIYNIGGFICINASAINAGAIQIGGTLPETARFYANMDASQPTVYIAGWKVNGDSLTKGNIGNNNSICLSSNGIANINLQTGNPCFGNSNLGDRWMLGIGSNFGVTTDGAIYASKGKIGGWVLKADSLVKYGKNDDGTDKTALNKELASDQAFIQPSGSQDPYKIAGQEQAGWALAIGSNFGVTTNGTLYATAGKIGGMSISTLKNDIDSKMSDTKYGNISWKFDAANGIYMYQGVNDIVFSITNDAGLYVKGNGEFSGKITATDGYIGTSASGFSITSQGLMAVSNKFTYYDETVASTYTDGNWTIGTYPRRDACIARSFTFSLNGGHDEALANGMKITIYANNIEIGKMYYKPPYEGSADNYLTNFTWFDRSNVQQVFTAKLENNQDSAYKIITITEKTQRINTLTPTQYSGFIEIFTRKNAKGLKQVYADEDGLLYTIN